MALLKPIRMTPARLAANRRNAQKSTGPVTERGKAQSSLNALRTGRYSRVYRQVYRDLLYAKPGYVLETARALLRAEYLAHPVIKEMVEMQRQSETGVRDDLRHLYGGRRR